MTIFQNSIGRWALHDGATYQYFESEQEAKMAEITTALAEQPAEYEIAAAVVGDVLPQLRQALLEMTWYANGIDAMIEQLAEEEAATLAGSPIAALQSWSAVFRALEEWLNAPLAGLNVPPTAVLAKRYTRKG